MNDVSLLLRAPSAPRVFARATGRSAPAAPAAPNCPDRPDANCGSRPPFFVTWGSVDAWAPSSARPPLHRCEPSSSWRRPADLTDHHGSEAPLALDPDQENPTP